MYVSYLYEEQSVHGGVVGRGRRAGGVVPQRGHALLGRGLRQPRGQFR